MRDFSKVNTSIWKSKKFTKLSPEHKLFYIYCLSAPNSNSCGLYVNQLGYMMIDLKWTEKQVRDSIDRVSEVGLIEYDYDEEVVFVDRWYEFNEPANPKHCIKIANDTLSIGSKKLLYRSIPQFLAVLQSKKWVLPEFIRSEIDRVYHTISIDTVAKNYPTVTETITETITETKGGDSDFSEINDLPIQKQNKTFSQKTVDGWGERPELENERWRWDFDYAKEKGFRPTINHVAECMPYGDFRFKKGMKADSLPPNYNPEDDPSNSRFNPMSFDHGIVKLRRSDFNKIYDLYGMSENPSQDEVELFYKDLEGMANWLGEKEHDNWFVALKNWAIKKGKSHA